MIEIITFTGIDENTELDRLRKTAKAWPFTEFAVLAGSQTGCAPRFPPRGWIDKWRAYATCHGIRTAIHLCGRLARNAAADGNQAAAICDGFSRVQVNLLPADRRRHAEALAGFQRRLKRPLILQHDGPWSTAPALEHTGIEHLFDRSGGRGQVGFEHWPAPTDRKRIGYAGGIGPENIHEAMKLANRNPKARTWLDMESRVRKNDDFDIETIETVCIEAARYR